MLLLYISEGSVDQCVLVLLLYVDGGLIYQCVLVCCCISVTLHVVAVY